MNTRILRTLLPLLAGAWLRALPADPAPAAGAPPPPPPPPSPAGASAGPNDPPPAKRVNYSDRSGLWLEIGKSTTIPIELTNRDTETVEDLLISVESDATWLDAAMAGDCKPVPGAQRVWSVPKVEAHGRKLPLVVQVTVRSTLQSAAAPAGTAPAAAEPTPPMEQANLRFVLWRTGKTGKEAAGVPAVAAPAVASSIPARNSWRMVYLVRAAPPEMVRPPETMEWHLVTAAPGELRPIEIKIRNANPNEPLKNLSAFPVSDQPYVSLDKRKDGLAGWITGREVTNVRTDTAMAGIPGLNVIAPNGEGSFSVGLRVAENAVPGSTATVALNVRASTPGTSPNPWMPFVLMQVKISPYNLPGNFEAYLYYNLPPDGKGPAGGAAAEWKPVPKGTKITVSQVYTLRGGEGFEKNVEQFVGFGNVIDDKGYVCCTIQPEVNNQPNIRLRIVAETIANEIQLSYKPDAAGGKVVDAFKALRPRCAVTPSGKRTYRNVSHTFLVKQEPRPTQIRQGKPATFFTPFPNQEKAFVQNLRILIPYYGYETVADAKAQPGIPINWEGELSTGGAINFFMDPSTVAGGMVDAFNVGAVSMFGPSPSMSGGDTATEYNWQLEKSTQIGLIYHNQNELFAVLDALVRAQDFLAELPFFQPGPDGKKNELPPVIAHWRRGRAVAGGETGYGLMDGVWRLMVQGNPEDPDVGDLGLILRGYGASIRHHFGKPPEAAAGGPAPAAPNYAYYRRTNLARAWEEGFDVFFAAAVMNQGRVLNEQTGPDQEKARTERSADLDAILATAAAGPDLYDDKIRRLRGADNSLAVAAGLWAVTKQDSPRRFLQWYLEKKGGSLAEWMTWMSSGDASLLQPLVQLGLCPRISGSPPGFLFNTRVDPRNVDIVWDPNDVLSAGKLSGKLLMGTEKAPAVAHTFKGDNRAPEVLSLGHLPDGVTGNGILAATGAARGPVFWTVETGYGDKGSFRWPLQSFLSTPPSQDLSKGGGMPVGKNGGSLTSPASNVRATATSLGVKSVFDGRKVLGGEVHRIGCYAREEDEGVSDFPEPVDLDLAWGEKEETGGATPGIYWLDPGEKRWKLVGTTPAGERRVRASITRSGAYALMIDTFPPALEEIHAWPNPFLSRQTNTAWRLEATLSEPALVSARILNATGQPVRVLAEKQMMEHGEIAFAWNGLDDRGRRVADGHYTYEMKAWDESGLSAPPVTGGVAVFNSGFGSVSGRVTASRENAAKPGVSLDGYSLPALVKDTGEFLLPAVPPGSFQAVFRCAGHFDEVRPVKVAGTGATVRMDDVQLSHLAIGSCRASGVLFSPDGDGTNDFVTLSYTWTRRCEYEVAVVDGEGRPVKTLRPRLPATPGPDALAWSGDDDHGKALPSGWYKAVWTAYNRDEAIPQTEVRVLLDRGLIQYASALPYLFSPNADGFDDTLQTGFNLEQAATVSLAVLGLDGTRLHAVTNSVALDAGWHTLEWDGRGRGGRVLPDGRYQFELTPVYAGGYTSKVVRGEFQSDSVPPEIGQVSPANGSVVREAMPRISARILSRLDDIDPDQLKFKIDENTVEAGEVDLKRGTFAYTPKTSLGPGVHIAIAYAQDWAGNYAPPQAVSFTIAFGDDAAKPVADRQPPEILSLSPAKNAKIYGDTPLITARVRDLGDGLDPENIRLTINGELQANSVQRFIPGKSGKAWDWYYYQKAMLLFDPLEGEIRYVPITPLPAGKTVVTLEVQDRAGNRSAKAESVFEVVVDREAPTVEITQPSNGAVLSRPPRMLLARIVDAGPGGVSTNSFRCLVDNREVKAPPGGFPFDPATGILQIPLTETLARDAQHLVAVSARDRAGNLSRTAISAFALVSDAEAPRVDLLLPSGSERFEEGFPVTIAAAVYDLGRAGLDPDGVELLLNGKAVAPYDFKAGRPGYVLSQNLLKHTFEQLPAGHYVLEIRCRDRAGNAAAPVVCTFDVLAR